MTTTAEQIPSCPKCASMRVHWRRRTQDWACDRCPHTWQAAPAKPAKEKK